MVKIHAMVNIKNAQNNLWFPIWIINTNFLGDSGGPLQVFDPENLCVHHIIGITSFGSKFCGGVGLPGNSLILNFKHEIIVYFLLRSIHESIIIFRLDWKYCLATKLNAWSYLFVHTFTYIFYRVIYYLSMYFSIIWIK